MPVVRMEERTLRLQARMLTVAIDGMITKESSIVKIHVLGDDRQFCRPSPSATEKLIINAIVARHNQWLLTNMRLRWHSSVHPCGWLKEP